MPYNFDEIIDRRPFNSIKWNHYPEDVIPMWVADTDFRSPGPIVRALHRKVEHGIFGYEQPPESLIETVRARLQRLYGWDVQPQHIIIMPGLVTGLNVVCRAVGQPGDGMLVQTPVYHPFLSAPRNHQMQLQTAPLTYVSDGPTFHYDIDFEAFEAAITENTRLFALCSPHNPIGHTIAPEQLTRLAEICLRHNVVVCSDEIHCDLLLNGQTHTPLATLAPEIAQNTITLMSPSKTFNIAGLFCSVVIAQNNDLLQRLRVASEGIVPWPNAMGLAAAEAAYQDDPELAEWLSSLLKYLAGNRDALVDFVTHELPALRTTAPSATYLAWLDCREANLPLDPYEFFLQKAKVGLSDGAVFGPNGQGFVRLNFGCPRAILMEALMRMKRAMENGTH